MAKGTVSRFDDKKGIGYISREDGEGIFVHHSSIQGDGFKNLFAEEAVEFEIVNGKKGLEVSKVVKL